VIDLNTQNLHTHSTFCDGADSPEEIVLEAISKGFDSIGFSGHSFMPFSDYLKGPDKTEEYKNEVLRLRGKYADRIKIYLGLEVDIYTTPDMTGYDYLIGSMHYFNINGKYIGFDRSSQEVERVINTYFDGNGLKYAEYYYKSLAELPKHGNFDIIGHFDLISKHSETVSFFDESSDKYLDMAFETMEILAKKIPFFEINSGAIARGYRTTPYPSISLIKHFKNLGLGAVITSDSHSKKMIDCNFDESAEILKMCGFKEKYILTDDGFKAVSL